MSGTVVEGALRATYHLSGSDAVRLRRLTRNSGLEAENVLSRLAIVTSLSQPDGPHSNYQPSSAGRTKEIKGSVLLGRPRQAALIVALALHLARTDFLEVREALTWHWARGLRLLDDASTEGDVVHSVAEQLLQQSQSNPTAQRRAERAGLGGSARDELAAAVGRRFTRWPTEVCRLVAMAAKLDPTRLDEVAERIAKETGMGNGALGETALLKLLQDKWHLNRLGLDRADRAVLSDLLSGNEVAATVASVPFLRSLGLVTVAKRRAELTALGHKIGKDVVHP